jgi:hypothetical protein
VQERRETIERRKGREGREREREGKGRGKGEGEGEGRQKFPKGKTGENRFLIV